MICRELYSEKDVPGHKDVDFSDAKFSDRNVTFGGAQFGDGDVIFFANQVVLWFDDVIVIIYKIDSSFSYK